MPSLVGTVAPASKNPPHFKPPCTVRPEMVPGLRTLGDTVALHCGFDWTHCKNDIINWKTDTS